MTRRVFLFFSIASVCVLALQMALVLPHLADDAFITFRYAQNVVDGIGLRWNPGETPVEGYSTPLGVVVASIAIALGLSPFFVAKLAGATAALATLVLLLTSGSVLSRTERVTAVVILLCSPDVAYNATGGMEATWTLPLMAYLVLRHLDLASFTARTYAAVGGVLLLLCLIRPEGHLVAVVFSMLHLWRYRRGQITGRSVWILVGPLLILLVAVHGARLMWFGDLLPNTYYAKHTGGGVLAAILEGALYLGERFFRMYGLFWFLAVWYLVRVADEVAVAGLVLLIAFPAFVLKVGGDDADFHGARLLIPILPLLYVYAARCLSALLLNRRSALLSVCALAVVGMAVNVPWYFFVTKYLYQLNTLTADASVHIAARWRTDARQLLAPELSPLSAYLLTVVAPTEYIAVPWAGRVPYETRLPTIDLVGLNDRHIAHLPKPTRGIVVKYDAEYVLSRRPRVICETFMLRGVQVSELAAMSDDQLLALGAIKEGQRRLLRSPILAAEYIVDANAPMFGCFLRVADRSAVTTLHK